jgi:hypothetical protein
MLEKFDKQRALAVEEDHHHHFTGPCVYGFGFLSVGENSRVSTVGSRVQNGGTKFHPQ